MSDHIHDFLAIGAGPFNLGLAALAEPIAELDGLVLESRPGFDWHPGMMLEGSHLQVPFMADLVTMADPTSPYSFLNYLKQADRLYRFYIREDFYPLRAEFNAYCQWVAGRLPNVLFGEHVTGIDYSGGLYRVRSRNRRGETVRSARRLVLGTGTVPYVPRACREILGAGGAALHNSTYLARKAELQARPSITIVGSGQSAAEIYYELLQDIDACGYELNWVTRSGRYFPLEYTKLTLELTSPEYVDYFHALPGGTRQRLNAEQKNLYKGIDGTLVNAIYDLLYAKSLAGAVRTRLLPGSAVTGASYDRASGLHRLELHHGEQDRRHQLDSAAVVLATGYQYREPDFLAGIGDRIRRGPDRRFDVTRDYSIGIQPAEIFVQNAELHTHGFVTPDLGMAAYRNSCIIRDMLGWEYYPVERRIAFQEFGAPLPGPAPEPVPVPVPAGAEAVR
ncbi:lysine N(6)-hydroxylase/L-ornithine N(5)-oxygenase family protein [Arthrobacter mangrovi]|uniref:L-lysine N6-monooxygenase MbtG n=1 Tax=Arthrobacter mangrovi TaxID=2966350 RepID=A0ABQ5MUW3_9MICC|nr:SidA/IucD/PvdA family monooxygenase [Arthrobacter mangrovi]GLB67759.1 monooxygenase [Arthrobacter mangrovi]